LVLVDHGVKVNEACHRNVMLLQQFLPTIRQISSEFFISTGALAISFLTRNFTRWQMLTDFKTSFEADSATNLQ